MNKLLGLFDVMTHANFGSEHSMLAGPLSHDSTNYALKHRDNVEMRGREKI